MYDKLLPKQTMVRLSAHICFTWPQWVKQMSKHKWKIIQYSESEDFQQGFCHGFLYTISVFTNRDKWTHWGRVTHICLGNLTIIGLDNGLSLGRPQAIIPNNAWILLIRPLGTNFSENLIEIHAFSFKKMHLKLSCAKWWPFWPGLNESN